MYSCRRRESGRHCKGFLPMTPAVPGNDPVSTGPRKVSETFGELPRTARRRAIVTTLEPTPSAERTIPPWRDTTFPVADRVALLLEQMTLEEKVAQLGSR